MEQTERTAQERLTTEADIYYRHIPELVWHSDGPAQAAWNKFEEAVEQAARAFFTDLREATEANVSTEARLGTVGVRQKFEAEGVTDSFFLYGETEAATAAHHATDDAIASAMAAYKRETIAAAEAGEIKPGADDPDRCEPCDRYPERQTDGRFVCPECAEVK